MKKVTNEGQQLTSATRQVRQQWVFGRRLSARFPCPAGQEIARNPPLRVASYVVGNINFGFRFFEASAIDGQAEFAKFSFWLCMAMKISAVW